MKNRIIIIFLIFISTLSYSQDNSESEVFRKIIDHEIMSGGFYIQCDKPKTFFDLKDFKEQTGLKVPLNILKEIEKKTENSNDGIWESDLLLDLNYGSDYINSKECLTKEDAEKLFKQTKKRQSIISISEPVFDENYENCIISVTYLKFKGSAYGHSFFLKKVYGIWTVIVTYDTWLT